MQHTVIKVASAVPTALGSTALPALLEKTLTVLKTGAFKVVYQGQFAKLLRVRQ